MMIVWMLRGNIIRKLSHFRSYMFGFGITNVNEPPSSFFCCLLITAGSIPIKTIVNKKQYETRGYLCRWLSTNE